MHDRPTTQAALLALLLGVGLGGCHAHECERRTLRCHAGEMQECHCETVSGMIAANTCTEPARWRPVRGVAGCVDTPDGPIGSRETCPETHMPDFCEESRAVSCRDTEDGRALAFATSCHGEQVCRINDSHAAVCQAPSDATAHDRALLLYTSHPVRLGDAPTELWAPALLPYDAQLHTDAGALLVVLLGDRVRAYRGGNVPIAQQGARVQWPRDAFARFLRDRAADRRTVDLIVSDAEQALAYQAFWRRSAPHLEAIVRASALWHLGDGAGARAVLADAEGETEPLRAARALVGR